MTKYSLIKTMNSMKDNLIIIKDFLVLIALGMAEMLMLLLLVPLMAVAGVTDKLIKLYEKATDRHVFLLKQLGIY